MSVVDDIKARLDVVETVSGYVTLQKAGRNFKAACPFHTEKTPSFIVNPERQSWRCFGACATGGDAFSFVMRKENLDFRGALELLARKTGVTLTSKSDNDRSEVLYRINQVAAKFYQDVLKSSEGKHGMKYLKERSVNAVSIARFELGMSPERWDGLKSHLLTKGFSENVAVEAGLVHRNTENGNSWDFFRGRLMFPIHNRQGQVAGFGARALDDSTPKYINTAQTSIFNKRNMLYGLHLASESIKADSTGIVVEGYMDVVAAHEHSYTNVVASMGTALTEQQVTQLKSLAKSFVLALDPDTAGQEATLRSLESSWRVIGNQSFRGRIDGRQSSIGTLYQREPLTLKIAALPAGRDPDKLIREDSKEWERLTQEAVPLMDYLIPTISAKFDLSTGQGRSQAVEALFPVIAATENAFDQERYFRQLAKTLDVSEEALKASIVLPWKDQRNQRRSNRQASDATPQVSASQLSSSAEYSIEDYTLALLLSRPELREHIHEFAPEHFHKSEDREVFTHWQSCSTIDDLWISLDESLHEHLTYLIQKELVPTDQQEGETALRQCLLRLERRHLLELQEALLASEDASVPPPREMEGEIASVNARIRELSSQRVR